MIWAWLVAKVGKVLAAIIAVVLFVMLAFLPFWLTWHAGWNARDAKAQTDMQDARVERLQQLVAFGEQIRGAVGDYVLRRGQDRIVYQTLKQEIPHVVNVYRAVPGAAAQPLPHCVFTNGFVGLWDDANAGRVRDPAATAGSDGGSAGAYSAAPGDLLDAGITQQQVLENHVDNAAIDRQLRDQLRLAQAYITQIQTGRTK